MNINSLQVYEDEIQSLEKEIKTLTEEYECNQHGSFTYSNRKAKKAMKTIKRKFQEDPKQYYSSPDLKTQLALLESDFSFLMNFTGIWFKNYSRKLLEKSEIKTVYKYRVSGNCQSVPFQLEFRLMEENQSNKNDYAAVADLNIIIESEESSDLSMLVSSQPVFVVAADPAPSLSLLLPNLVLRFGSFLTSIKSQGKISD
ncbi:UNVERIFIED_CONTAM: hypothetical protein K2H54_045420 [Gekko kuhli]